jgi:AbrB family looped-hinge helix DNA binding protein
MSHETREGSVDDTAGSVAGCDDSSWLTGDSAGGREDVSTLLQTTVFLQSIVEVRRLEMATTVSSKGQVTIPKRIREGLGLKAGSQVDFILENGHAIIEPVERGGVQDLAGSLKQYARRLKGKTHRQVLEETRREVADAAAREGLPDRRKRSP